MVFGESGGGAKTSCIYALPVAQGHFNKASIESGPGIHMTPRDLATETATMVLTELGLSTREVAKLKDIPADKLVEVQGSVAKKAPGNLTLSGGRQGMVVARPGGFGPVVDGTYLPHHPFDPTAPAISRDKPLMVGTNRDEMAFFYWERKATDLFTLTDDGLQSQLGQGLPAKNAEDDLATYRKSRPGCRRRISYCDHHLALMARLHRNCREEGRPESRARLYVHVHSRIELDRAGHEPSTGRSARNRIWYKFDNVDAGAPNPERPSLIGTDPDRRGPR